MAAYLATHLLQDAYRKIGISTTAAATGGSETTVVDASIGDRYADNDMKNGSMFIVRDTAGAAPEGEWGVISGYTQSNGTFSLSSPLTAAVGSGDVYMFTMPFISLYEMLELANQALRSLGDIALPYTLTTAANQTEYTLPVELKRADIISVEVQKDNGGYSDVGNWAVVPSAPGQTGLFVIPQYTAGKNIRVVYRGPHPTLTAYNSPISETIYPELISNLLVKAALGWYNGRTGGSEDYWLQKENEYSQKAEFSLVKYPVWKPSQQTKWNVLERRM